MAVRTATETQPLFDPAEEKVKAERKKKKEAEARAEFNAALAELKKKTEAVVQKVVSENVILKQENERLKKQLTTLAPAAPQTPKQNNGNK